MPRQNVISEIRFKEEIFEEYYPNDLNKYKISTNKKCTNKNNEENFYIDSSQLCWNCYYREFLKKLKKMNASQQRSFLINQLSIRQDKPRFLQDLKYLIKDNSNWLDEHYYSTSQEYLKLIDDLNENLLCGLKDKIRKTHELLYQNRQNLDYLELKTVLNQNGFFWGKAEIKHIFEYFEINELAEVIGTKDGLHIKINSNGILAFEETDNEDIKSNIETNSAIIEAIIGHIDKKFEEAKIDQLQNFQVMEEIADEIQNELQVFCTKPTIFKLIKMRFSEAFIKGIVNKSIVDPMIEEAMKFLL